MLEVFSEFELKKLGFQEELGGKLEDGGYYRWWTNDALAINLSITYEYNDRCAIVNSCVEIADESLSKSLSKIQILQLIEILK